MPPARRTTSAARKVQDKPRITGLNLDTLQREGGPAEPYVTVLGGRPYTFSDPAEDDWQDQVRIDPQNAVAQIRALMSPEDWDSFKQFKMPAWKLVALFKDIRAYYAVDEGNDDASLT